MFPCLQSIEIQGYRPFRDFIANFGPLEVLVGANGSGKTSLFEFLKFLRDSMRQEIPPEIVAGAIGQQIFHRSWRETFGWSCGINFDEAGEVQYSGELQGPIGKATMIDESAYIEQTDEVLMNVNLGEGEIYHGTVRQRVSVKRSNQLALSTITNPDFVMLYNLREYIGDWRFYSAFHIASDKIRRSVPVEQEPVLNEDASNLSSVLFYLFSEHPSVFDDLQQYLRFVIPGFKRLSVKARGGPGEVIAFWQETGLNSDLTLADLSDGILRLICWFVLCVQPNPPTLICIDEPDQGVHPRTLPVLAGLLKKASERTQVFVATHASYFLMQFALSELAVFRKENGEAKFFKPANSKILMDNLQDFGPDELEIMHRNDELEQLA